MKKQRFSNKTLSFIMAMLILLVSLPTYAFASLIDYSTDENQTDVIESEEKPQYELLIRAYSYLFGLPIMLISNSNTIACDLTGEICGGSREKISEIILPTKKTYRVVQNKRRGVF